MSGKMLTGKRIGVLGKGGSGKSTITVLVAKALKDKGYDVRVLDADSTNIGLHQALGLEQSPDSLINYFGGTLFSGGTVTCPVDDPTLLPGAEITLSNLPNRYYIKSQEGILLLVAGKIGDKGPGAGCDGPISKISRDLRIYGSGDYPVTLIDLKAGLEDSARGVITSLDLLITVVDPTSAAIQMAVDTQNMVEQIKAGKLPATEHLKDPVAIETANRIFREAKVKDAFALLNKIRNAEESYIKGKLEERGVEPIGVVHEDPSISISWLKGNSLEAGGVREDVEEFIERLEEKLKAL